MKIKNKTKAISLIFICILLIGFVLPENLLIPVKGATAKDWNQNTFWYEPWGRSGEHKGIDIFSTIGRPVLSSTYGIVLYRGKIELGGNVIVVLGPKWRVHYYAHLGETKVAAGSWVSTSEVMAVIGDSGNAKGKQPHLHYSILTLVPYPWRWDNTTHGWKKMFYLNPANKLLGT